MPAAVDATEDVVRGSPREAVSRYLQLCRKGRYAEAADWLHLSASQRARGPELAQRLHRVMSRYVWLDVDTISDQPDGNQKDGLPFHVEELGKIKDPTGLREPLRLTRVQQVDGTRWLFARASIDQIDDWYETLKDRWIIEHLPPALLREGPFELLYWQWLAVPLITLLAWLLGAVLSRVSCAVGARLARRTRWNWDDRWVERSRAPLTLAWMTFAAYGLLRFVGLYQPAEQAVAKLLQTALLFAFFWEVLRTLEVLALGVVQSQWARTYPSSRALVPLAGRAAKLILGAIAIVATLAHLGYSVTSLVAGLGIGGVAVALAAQKTVENLFGAFSLGVDQPIREGDFIKVEDVLGTVEAIGLRSTRIRTLDRTLVAIPNGKLAEMRLESFTVRDRLRLACNLGIAYQSSAAQLREVLTGFERVLRSHPKIWSESVVVRFSNITDNALVIEVMAWFTTTDYAEFQLIRQETLLAFMDVVESAQTQFAFPTRIMQLVQGPNPTPGPVEP